MQVHTAHAMTWSYGYHPKLSRLGEEDQEEEEDLPATTTWGAEFLLREGLSREVMGKWMANEAVP